jgi:hypothetical protein
VHCRLPAVLGRKPQILGHGDALWNSFLRYGKLGPFRSCRNPKKLSFPAEDVGIFDRASPASLLRTRYRGGRDPESRKLAENHNILDPPPLSAAGDDEWWHSLSGKGLFTI